MQSASEFSPSMLLPRFKRLARLVRLQPFDVSTPEGRSAERHRRIALSGAAAIAAKVVSVLSMFFVVRLTARYLGNERYGMWMTVSSVTLMFIFADLGIGNGLVNALSDADGRNDREAAAGHVASGFYLLTALAAALGLIFAAVYPFVPWPRVFNVKTPLAAVEAGPAMAAMAACFLLGLPLNLVSRVHVG